jgi:hypothetical protein
MYGGGVRAVESWWDGSWSTLWARRLHLETDGHRWQLRRTTGSERVEDVYGPATEEQARAELGRQLAEGEGWRQIR